MKIDQENELCKAYRAANPLPYAEKEIPNDLLQLIEKQKVVPRAPGKRKVATPTGVPSPKRKKSKKQKSKPVLLDEDSETESDPHVRKVQSSHPSPHNSPNSHPITSEPITTTTTDPIPISPLKTPTSIPVTSTVSTPDYREQLENPMISLTQSPIIPPNTSQTISQSVPTSTTEPTTTFVQTTTTEPTEIQQHEPESILDSVESDAEFQKDFEMEDPLSIPEPGHKPKAA